MDGLVAAGDGLVCQDRIDGALLQPGFEIADRFAGRHDDRGQDRFAGIDIYGAPGTPPQIDGATALPCDVQQTVRSGSHLIALGHVRDVLPGAARPLTYRDGCYHRVLPQTKPVRMAAT